NAHRRRGIVLVLLLLGCFQLLSAATQLSATVDEGFHITSGYEYVRTGHLRLFDEHAPLAKALFAWPLTFVPDLTPPEQATGYAAGNLIEVAQATVLAYRPIDRVIVAARIPVTLLTLVLVATIYRWVTQEAGATAGLFALAWAIFDPNLLAHGSLAATDMGATAFIFWSTYAFSRYLRHPDRRHWWAAALLLGLAQGAKLTALLLYPVLGLLALLDAWIKAPQARRQALRRRALSYAGMVAVSAVVLWGLYGFEIRTVTGLLAHVPLPAAGHIERWLRLRENLAYGRESFLLGQNGMHGWWQYFPVAFAVKTPLPMLILTLWAGLRLARYVFRRRYPTNYLRQLPRLLSLTLFPILYAVSSLSSPINIGYRHLLPLLPFLYVGIGNLVGHPGRVARSGDRPQLASCRLQVTSYKSKKPFIARYALRFTFYALLLWQIAGSLLLAPHFLTFYNEIAGGADNGWRFLADSNSDWGQTLKALAAYQREHELGPVRLSQFTFLDPAAYGVDYVPIAPMTGAPPVLPQRFDPAAGLYAISATTLDGVPLPYPPTFDWFRHREPLTKIGHAMFLYDVQSTAGKWLAQCTTPVAPLTPAANAEGFGHPRLRQITFDCAQSWVVPGDGSGWYARAIPAQEQLRWPRRPDNRFDLWPA
ncbi:MAG: glycosyltransferase family 39 protein, partial [Chloroflexota bacterium]|nr:glycosyltransferase family 39 protein [Chloroflexota bacterium]